MLLLLSSDNYHKAYCWHYYYRVNSLEKYLVQYLSTANNCDTAENRQKIQTQTPSLQKKANNLAKLHQR